MRVSRYIGGTRPQFQDVLNLFDIVTVSGAYQRAVQLEKQFARRGVGVINSGLSGSGGRTSVPLAPIPAKPDAVPPPAGSSRARCFSCGETGHRFADCKRGPRKGLFADSDEFLGEPVDGDSDPVFEDTVTTEEEHLDGDCGPLLVVRRSCLAPRGGDDDWLRTNVFQSTCTIGGKICRFIVDSGSCENVISEETVRKLQLVTEAHPRPYKLTWLDKRNDVTVARRSHVSFSIGPTYRDKIWCDVVAMDACHLLLGRPWLYDRKVIYDGFLNTYVFTFNSIKITLLPRKDSAGNKTTCEGNTLLSMAMFEAVVRESGVVYVLLGREDVKPSDPPSEFKMMFPKQVCPPFKTIVNLLHAFHGYAVEAGLMVCDGSLSVSLSL
ncbi:hypothetical protein LWI29_021945 [Acer saccharum]|uniref:CCHC-type domain-containing protein n=1 Tax=Acer saccharum TaxID=4024 RepID=A0AA39SX69_ACESA|nr:hypothetical protein LWI29_021945 [Acer saccharum]